MNPQWFLFLSDNRPIYEISSITENILGLSNIFGSLLVLGMPMGMYSLYLEQERNKSEQLLHNIMPKACLLYTSPSPRDATLSRMPSSA